MGILHWAGQAATGETCIIATVGDIVQGGVRTTDVTGAERQELAAVLASPTFARAQRLVKLLEFICEKHFEGHDADVCEYSIATEVLGRPADFDPGEDAIARVEIHRLRKKLRDYYAAEGPHKSIKIIIPPGLYTPVFKQDGAGNGAEAANGKADAVVGTELAADHTTHEPELAGAGESTPAVPRAGHRRFWFIAVVIVVVVAAAILVPLLARRTATVHPPVAPLQTIPPPLAVVPDNSIRIIAGYDRKYTDHDGHTWLPDRYFDGGGRPHAPFRTFFYRTADPLLYQNGRIGLTAYNIPLKPGNYELKLHFVEPVYGPGLETGGGENSRVFDILVNGKVLIGSFDIVSDAGGPLIADVRTLKDIEPGADGFVHIGFHAQREQPIISAIEIEPAPLHRINPIRIVTQPNSVTDSAGQVWQADTYFAGGQASNHYKVVTGTPDSDLFANERYGHFSYAIPVAPGSYTATMYFAETYWGTENLGGGGPGQRVFDVFCNGSAELRNLDMLKEAAPNRALIKRFRGLKPNAQGKLYFDFIPSVNYASVFAIEVLDEGR